MLAPLDGSDRDTSPATGDFYFQASDGSVILPAAGYNYDIDWTSYVGGTCTRWNGSWLHCTSPHERSDIRDQTTRGEGSRISLTLNPGYAFILLIVVIWRLPSVAPLLRLLGLG